MTGRARAAFGAKCLTEIATASGKSEADLAALLIGPQE